VFGLKSRGGVLDKGGQEYWRGASTGLYFTLGEHFNGGQERNGRKGKRGEGKRGRDPSLIRESQAQVQD